MRSQRQVMLPGLLGLTIALSFLVSVSEADTPKAPPLPPAASKEKLPSALTKPVPADVADLKAIQAQVKKVLAKVLPATVGILVEIRENGKRGISAGSGVIINKEGYILTAGHVSGEPEKPCTIILPDGKRIKGVTLGRNQGIDSGMIKITDKSKENNWPHVTVGDSNKLAKGQWVIAVGHPGGFNPNRTPPVRLGRILSVSKNLIQTDCTLIAGDSGGPLFDLEGKLVGIHSRISRPLTSNIHVPVNTYRDTWDRLVANEDWGSLFGFDFSNRRGQAYLGIGFDRSTEDLVVSSVTEGYGADKAGIIVGDVIVGIDGKKITTRKELTDLLGRKRPNQTIEVEVNRDGKSLKLKVKLSRRPAE